MRTYPSGRLGLAIVSVIALTAGGCESPDPEAVMNSFREAALSDAGDANINTGCGDVRPVPEGDYFCALSANLARQKPLFILLTFALDGDQLTVDAQPLVRDHDEDGETMMADARQPIGDPFPQVVTEYGEDGSFSITWADVTVLGAANEVTYRDIGGTLILDGAFVTDDVAFGTMSGEVVQPTFVPLAGSTFACERTDDPTALDPVYYNADILAITPCAPDGSGMGSGDAS